MRKLNDQELAQLGLRPQMPRHIGIIMDGNGRWAEQRGLKRREGHRAGTERLREIIRMASDLGIEALSLYAFSTENWKRPVSEVTALFALLVEYFTNEIEELDANGVCVRILGDTSPMPLSVRHAIAAAEKRTAENNGLRLCIALNYGSRAEMLRAVQSLAADTANGTLRAEDITEELFAERLYTKGLPSLDMVIRTGGEQRLSNFLMYQAAYAEFLFLEKLWPDFAKEDLVAAIADFQRRDRRYGGLKQK